MTASEKMAEGIRRYLDNKPDSEDLMTQGINEYESGEWISINKNALKRKMVITTFLGMMLREMSHIATDEPLSGIEKMELYVGNNWKEQAIERYNYDPEFHAKVDYSFAYLTKYKEEETE